jgi:hypothetical protein
MTPLLILLFGIHPATAVGSDVQGSMVVELKFSLTSDDVRNMRQGRADELLSGRLVYGCRVEILANVLVLVKMTSRQLCRHRLEGRIEHAGVGGE